MTHPDPDFFGRLLRVARVVSIVSAIIAPLASCEEKPASPRAAAPATDDAHTYTVRGRLASLPEAGKPTSQLMIHHEAIPTFVGKDGKVVGMSEMTMPFLPARGVSLDGLANGDAVEFTFEVRWSPRASSTLTRIAKLPEGTTPSLKSGN